MIRPEHPGVSRRRRRFTSPVCWALVVGVASVTPPAVLGAPAPGGPIPLDLLLHGVGYAILAGLIVRADPHIGLGIPVLSAAAFGIGIEAIQFVLPYRDASILDATVNVAGAILGAATARLVPKWRTKFRDDTGG